MEPELSLNNFNKYLNSLLPESETKTEGSWEVHGGHVYFVDDSDHLSSGAIKAALQQMKEDLESFDKDLDERIIKSNPTEIKICHEKLESLRKLVMSKVQSYHEQHSGVIGYLKEKGHASLHGSVDEMKDQVLAKIGLIDNHILNKSPVLQSSMLKGRYDSLTNLEGKVRALPVQEGPLSQILSNLSREDFKNFSDVIDNSKVTEKAVDDEWVKRMRELGFKGNDKIGATQYARNLENVIERQLENRGSNRTDLFERLFENIKIINKFFRNYSNLYFVVHQYLNFEKNAIETVELLLKVLYPAGKAAVLSMFLQENDKITAQLFLEAGADVNANYYYLNPLGTALMQKGSIEFAKQLLDKGANVNIPSREQNPLLNVIERSYASRSKKKEWTLDPDTLAKIQLLKDYGADIEIAVKAAENYGLKDEIINKLREL